MVAIGLWQGFIRGFVSQLFLIVSVVAALFLSFLLFPKIGGWLETQLHFPISYARPLALGVVFFTLTFVLQFLSGFVQKMIGPMVKANMINRVAGTVLGALRQLLNVAIALAIVISLPVPAEVKANIDNSKLAPTLLKLALTLEDKLASLLHDDSLKSLSYRIVGTEESTSTALNYTVADPKIDTEGELKMLALTNAVRHDQNVGLLIPNPELQAVARAHAKDMLNRGYFAHVSPEGKDALARIQDANIAVFSVGENLASAATVDIAEGGLLASPGHRKNILNPDFNQVGIGVLDAGKHGKMVVEVFAKRY
jgi:uncharacterized protein YkwD